MRASKKYKERTSSRHQAQLYEGGVCDTSQTVVHEKERKRYFKPAVTICLRLHQPQQILSFPHHVRIQALNLQDPGLSYILVEYFDPDIFRHGGQVDAVLNS